MFHRLRFHNQLILIFSVGIFILALATTLVVTDVAKKAIRERILNESLSVTDNLAEQSTLSLLYQSKDNAKEVVSIFMTFPDVVGIELLNKDYSKLYASGYFSIMKDLPQVKPEKSQLILEDDEHWFFFAPVLAGSKIGYYRKNRSLELTSNHFNAKDNTDLSSQNLVGSTSKEKVLNQNVDENIQEVIGYVRLAVSKKSLADISYGILSYNLIVLFMLSVILLFFLLIISKRLTRPIAKLSQAMLDAQKGKVLVRAELDGPRDIDEIKKSFNAMMAELERREGQIKDARDKAYQSAAEKARFAANVSHELRTPMNGVLGMLDLLPDNGLTETQLEYVRIAKKSAQSLLSLIDDVLDFSKNESLTALVESKPFSLIEMLDDITALLGPKAQESNIDFCYIIERNIPENFDGDADKVRQVLINLVGNALKFTYAGSVSIHVKKCIDFCPTDKEKIAIMFSVRDTGVGVSDDAKNRIFEAFAQGDNSPTRQYSGTGLGLAISRQLVDILDGDLSVSSEQGKGSDFSFTIPLKPLPHSPSFKIAQGKIKSCLIIAKHTLLSQSIAQMLEDNVEQIHHAASTNEAIRLINFYVDQGRELSVIILDSSLQSDFDFLCTIKSAHYLKNVGFILLGYSQKTSSTQMYPPDMFLTKPVMRKSLLSYLRDTYLCAEGTVRENNKNNAPDSGNHKLRGKKILVVEDIETNWLVIRGMLQTLNCEAEIAKNGKECLTMLAEKSFDLVLMDCHMPIMDGYAATTHIRNQEKKTGEHKVIVAMTANNLNGEKEKCYIAGMDDFLPKPLSRLDLKNMLLHWLAQQDELPKTITEDIKRDEPVLEKIMKPMDSDVVDAAKVMELKAQMGDAMSTLIASFVSHIEDHIKNLDIARKTGDLRRMKFIAHAIKGSASNFGAAKLVAKSKYLETKVDTLDSKAIVENIDAIREEGMRVIAYFRNV